MKRKGFTLVEIIITISLLTVVVAPIVTAFMAGMKSTESIEKDFNMEILAEELLNEIMSRDYEDKEYYGSIGKEEGEVSRLNFDDVDDYDGFLEDFGQIADISGNVQSQYSDYKRRVEVYNSNGQRISSSDGLKYEAEKLTYFNNVLTNIKLSRDGNRIFAVNNSNKNLIVANPFSGTVEAQITLPELPLGIETTPDSKTVYVNYGDMLEVYSYSPGNLNLTGSFSGESIRGIKDMTYIDGKLATVGENGFFVDFEEIGDYSQCYFLYTDYGRTVMAHSDKVLIFENVDLNTSIYSFTLPTSKLTSAFYDVFNDEFVFTTNGDYIFKYSAEDDTITNPTRAEYEKLNSIVYSYIDDEYYFGGEDGDSDKFFKTDGGYLGKAEPVKNTEIIDMEFLKDSGEILYLTETAINIYSLRDRGVITYNKPQNLSDKYIDIKVTSKHFFILARDGIYRVNREDLTDYSYFAKSDIETFAVNNQEVLFSDGTLLYSLSKELTDLKTFNYFSGIDKIVCSKDGKTLFMSSKTNQKLYYLDTFTNAISDIDYEFTDWTLSASGNTLITSQDNGDVDFINSKNITSNSTESVYTDLINIDKEDRFIAFSENEKKIDFYSYQDVFEDHFIDFKGYSFASYSPGANEGFRINEENGKVEINTKPVIGVDENTNVCSVLFYRTFVFPIPKYLRSFTVEADVEGYKGDVEFFCYNGMINKALLDQTSGSLSDAPVKTKILSAGNFQDTYSVPPSNILSIGFKIDDSDTSDFSSLTLSSLKIRFNRDTAFSKVNSKITDFNSINDWKMSWDNKYLYIASGNTFYTYDLDKKIFIPRKRVQVSDATEIYSIEVSKDNNTIFLATDNGMYSIKEPVKTKIIRVIVENTDKKVEEYVLSSSVSNWKTEHKTRVIPHLLAREFVFTSNEYNDEITEDTIWSSDRQYIVENELLVKSGNRLIITDDTVVKFENGARIKFESGALLYAENSIFTSVNDNSVGVCLNSSAGLAISGDYAGLEFLDGADVHVDGCEFYYASNALLKQGNSFFKVNNTIFSKNLVAMSLNGTYSDVEINSNIFKENQDDLVLETFSGEFRNNIFTGTTNRSIDLNNCPDVSLISNIFTNIQGEVLYSNAGQLKVHDNSFSYCSNVITAIETGIDFANNNINSCQEFFDLTDYVVSGSKDLIVTNNIFASCDKVLRLSGSIPNLDIKARFNYFVRSQNEVENTSSKLADLTYNYWGDNQSRTFINTNTEPFILFGRIDQSRQYNGDAIIRHHLRINPDGSALFEAGRLYLFSEFIKPFIEIRKSTGGQAGSFTADSMIIDQDTVEVSSIFTDTGLTPQSEWEGFRIYGDISLKNSVVDQADCLFSLRSQKMVNPANHGPTLKEIIYNRFGEDNDFYFGFYPGENGDEFNVKSEMMSFNIFEKNSDLIDIASSYIPVPLADPLDWRYNYWGDNNISVLPDDILEDVITVFPRAVQGSIDSSITVPYYPETGEQRLVCLGDVEVNATVSFQNVNSAPGVIIPQVIMTGDDGFKISSSGSVQVPTTVPYAEFNDIRVLDLKFAAYRDWDRWGGIDPDTDPENLPIGLYSTQGNIKFNIKSAKLVWENLTRNNTVGGVLQFDDCFILVSENRLISTNYNGLYFQMKDSVMGFKDNASFRLDSLNSLSSIEFTANKIGPYNVDFFTDGIKDTNGNTTPSKYFDFSGTSSDSASMVEFTDNKFYRAGGVYFKFVPQNIEILNNTFDACYGLNHLFTLENGLCNVLIESNEFGELSQKEPVTEKVCGSFIKTGNVTVQNGDILENIFADSYNTSESPFDFHNLQIADNLNIRGNQIVYTGSSNTLFKLYNLSETVNDDKPDSLVFSNNIFYKPESGSEFYLLGGSNIRELAFYFNHSNSGYAFNLSGSANSLMITNNNFKGFDGSISTANKTVMCNYIENPPFSASLNPFPLPNPVDISLSADFQVISYDTSEIYGMDVYNDKNYIYKDKDVQFTLTPEPAAIGYDFGEFEALFTSPTMDNSIGSYLVRDIKSPPAGSLPIPGKNKGYFILNRMAGTDNFIGTFTINGQINSDTDYSYINADWNDLIKVSIPVFGLINGVSSFPVPMPMPDPPEPPLPFELTKLNCPINGFDYDGKIDIEWERNVDPYHPVFFYKINFVKKDPSGGSDIFLPTKTISGAYDSYKNYSRLEPGDYYILIRAYNNSPYSPTTITEKIEIDGDSSNSGDVFRIPRPPKVIGPDNFDISEISIGNDFIRMDNIPGANLYLLEYAKFTVGFDSSEVGIWEETMSNNNKVFLNNLNGITPGVYIFRAKAGYKDSDGNIELTDYGRPKIILVKKGKTVAVLVSDRTSLMVPGSEIISHRELDPSFVNTGSSAGPFEQMVLPLSHLKSNSEINSYQNAIILRLAMPNKSSADKNNYDDLTIQMKNELINNGIEDPGCIDVNPYWGYDYDGVLENIDVLLINSNWETEDNLRILGQANPHWSILASDAPLIFNSGILKSWFLSEMKAGTTGYASNNMLKAHPLIGYTPPNKMMYINQSQTSGGMPLGIEFDTELFGNIVDLSSNLTAPEVIHNVNTGSPGVAGYSPDRRLLIATEESVFGNFAEKKRKVFINQKPFMKKDRAYYQSGGYTLTMNDILNKCLKYVLFIAPPVPGDFDLTYMDYDSKGVSNPEDYYKRTTNSASLIYPTFIDLDGNLQSSEVGRQTPMLTWDLDKDVDNYAIVSNAPGLNPSDPPYVNIGFRDSYRLGQYYNIKVNPPSTTKEYTFTFIAENSSGSKERGFKIRYVGKPVVNISDSVWPGDYPPEATGNPGDNGERASVMRLEVFDSNWNSLLKKNYDVNTSSPYLSGPHQLTALVGTNAYDEIGKNHFKAKFGSKKPPSDSIDDLGHETGAEVTGRFKIAPPKPIFIEPAYNVDLMNDGGYDYYEDWDGNYIIKLTKPAIFNPPDTITYYLRGKPEGYSSYSLINLTANPPYASVNTEDLGNSYKQPGWIDYLGSLSYNSVESAHLQHKVKIPAPPVLTSSDYELIEGLDPTPLKIVLNVNYPDSNLEGTSLQWEKIELWSKPPGASSFSQGHTPFNRGSGINVNLNPGPYGNYQYKVRVYRGTPANPDDISLFSNTITVNKKRVLTYDIEDNHWKWSSGFLDVEKHRSYEPEITFDIQDSNVEYKVISRIGKLNALFGHDIIKQEETVDLPGTATSHTFSYYHESFPVFYPTRWNVYFKVIIKDATTHNVIKETDWEVADKDDLIIEYFD